MSRYGYPEDDNAPLMYVRGYPIYAAYFLVALFSLSMIATALLQAVGQQPLLTRLVFDSAQLRDGEFWRAATYGFVNPPSVWFAIGMFMFGWFGRDLERVWGRSRFLLFYGCLYLLCPLVGFVAGFWRHVNFYGESAGFAVFIAFVTVYPNIPFFFGILSKWLATILLGLYTLIHLSERNVPALMLLWSTCGFAFVFVRFQQGSLQLPRWSLFERKPKLRVLPDLPAARKESSRPSAAATPSEIDALLDKIAQSGIGSLTPKERAKLDEASRRDGRKR